MKKMPSFGMLCRVAFVRIDVSEERSSSIIRVTRMGELRKTLASLATELIFHRTVRRLLVTINAPS
jgi:hypothetical protein